MKRLMLLFTVIVLLFTINAYADDMDRVDEVDWEHFSKNLVAAFQVDNAGVQAAALKNIIAYTDYLDVSDAVFDIMKLYRYSDDERVRQMAVVALHRIGHKRAMYVLKRNLKFEDNPTIQRQIAECILQNQNKSLAQQEQAVESLLAELSR